MVIRAVTLAGGMMCAVAFSQFPEYSQQYTQRLAGAVEELSRVVERFDADAASLDMTRKQALSDMLAAGDMAAARAESMRGIFDRYEKLRNDLNALRVEAPVAKAAQFWHMSDPDVARKAWEDFRPAIPVTMDGIGFGLAGFLAGLSVFAALRSILRLILLRSRAAV